MTPQTTILSLSTLFSTTVVRPSVQTVPGKIGEASPADYTHWKATRLIGRTRTKWRDYTPDLAWPRLGVEPVELSEVAENRQVYQDILELLPP